MHAGTNWQQDALSPFDSLDLLASFAALQLLPANAGRMIRLIALAHSAASLPYVEGLPRISSARLSKICNDLSLSRTSIAELEDPCENRHTEEVTFFGGSYLVFPGDFEDVTFIFRRVCAALFLVSEELPDQVFARDAREPDILTAEHAAVPVLIKSAC